jgi:hypothetical protein
MESPSLKPSLGHKNLADLAVSGEALQGLMQEVLSTGASFQFRAKGHSMTPFIKDGDVITVAPTVEAQPALGKIVAFIHPVTGLLVVHRVIGRRGSIFLIQGDNAPRQSDGLVPDQSILGCVTRIQRDQRRVSFGLGPERYLLVLLSRIGLLNPILKSLRAIKRIFPNQVSILL